MSSAVKQQRTLVIASSVDPSVPLLLKQLGMACRNAKLILETFDLESSLPNPALDNYSSILLVCPLTVDENEELLDLIEAYVRDGGGLVVVNPRKNSYIGKLCGIDTFHTKLSETSQQTSSADITFLVDLFPAISGLTQSLMLADVMANHTLDETAQNELVASDSLNRPFAWRRQHGAGRVLVWNVLLSSVEWGQSWLMQSILSVQDVAVRGIANVAMVQIDDFPAPFVNTAREPVLSEFNMPTLEFLDKIWLPDMLEIADKYGVLYSFALPFNYNATIDKPFDFAEWDAETIFDGIESISYGVYFARMIGDKHELCLHGYNHIPLLIENWGTRQAMIDSLNAALDKWAEDGLGSMPSCYVAPMNQYDRDGVLALKECLPSLKVICTARSQNRGVGGRQFEPEPWNRELFCLPRLTYGYQFTEGFEFDMISAIAELGVWTHFVHPDDIFDIDVDVNSDFLPRNSNSSGWRGNSNGSMKDNFEQCLEFAKNNFPWLRYLNATQAGEQIQSHLDNKLEVYIGENEIELRSEASAFVQLRIDRWHGKALRKPIEADEHCSITVLDQYEADSYSLCTLQIPAGTSKMKLI